MPKLAKDNREMVDDLKKLYGLDMRAISKEGLNPDEAMERRMLNQKYNWMSTIPTLFHLIDTLDKDE